MARHSQDLLAQARMLARREPRSPKQATLRRSVSTAYYALFHFLIEEVTRLTVGAARNRADLRRFAGRAFVHGKMRVVCAEFRKNPPTSDLLKPFWLPLNVAANPNVRTVASNFVVLQEFRHEADYDLTRVFTRIQAETAANQAKDAMDAWQRLKTGNPELSRLFALSLILWPSIGAR